MIYLRKLGLMVALAGALLGVPAALVLDGPALQTGIDASHISTASDVAEVMVAGIRARGID